jgi:hypothetical protein
MYHCPNPIHNAGVVLPLYVPILSMQASEVHSDRSVVEHYQGEESYWGIECLVWADVLRDAVFAATKGRNLTEGLNALCELMYWEMLFSLAAWSHARMHWEMLCLTCTYALRGAVCHIRANMALTSLHMLERLSAPWVSLTLFLSLSHSHSLNAIMCVYTTAWANHAWQELLSRRFPYVLTLYVYVHVCMFACEANKQKARRETVRCYTPDVYVRQAERTGAWQRVSPQ